MLLNQFFFFFYNLIFQLLHYFLQLGFSQPQVTSSRGCGTPNNVTLRLVVYHIHVHILRIFRTGEQLV
uniref:Putative salivary lipocalin n=1 Tax=Ixodes ricinus TaxID=34613 RepID=A0A6B0TQP3_IXORI